MNFKQSLIKMFPSLLTRPFIFIFVFLVISALAIVLDIPVLRQVMGFLFLTLIPGLLIIYILKLDGLGLTERIVLSVGVSISFVMLFGIILDWVCLSLGYPTPLALGPLLVSFSLAIFILSLIAWKTNKQAFRLPPFHGNLDITQKLILLPPALFVLLSILGSHLMNTTGNNITSMVFLFLIMAYVTILALFHRRVQKETYPIIIFLLSISLLLLFSLRTHHVIGSDVHYTYNLFRLTWTEHHWHLFYPSAYNACLSITLLPAIYQSFLNIDSEYLFKILYSILCSVSPLVVYIISRKYVGEFYAFLASFFFMAQWGFLWTAFNDRSSLATLFFALMVLALLHDDISQFNKRVLFIIFAMGIVFSHYATVYLCLFVLLFSWVVEQVLLRIARHRRKTVQAEKSTPEINPPTFVNSTASGLKRGIGLAQVFLLFMLTFLWYAQLTGTGFWYAVRFARSTLVSLQDFFLLAARGQPVSESLFGIGFMQANLPQKIEFIFIWLTIFLLAIGVLTTIGRYKKMISAGTSSTNTNKAGFLQNKLDVVYFALSLACILILVLFIAIPGISSGYARDRTFLLAMVVLSPFFVIGAVNVAGLLKLKPYFVILAVLIPFFMCMSGLMSQVFSVPKSIILNSEGPQYNLYYVHEQESYAAQWLRDNTRFEEVTVYTDFTGHTRLVSQAGLPGLIDYWSLLEKGKRLDEGYIYLRSHNVVDGKLLDVQGEEHEIDSLQDKFVGKNRIYTSGGSEIWR